VSVRAESVGISVFVESSGVLHCEQVIPARIPIVKCYLKVHGMKIAADISMGVKNGVEAVPFIMEQVLHVSCTRFNTDEQ
jgi:hypothetical protein